MTPAPADLHPPIEAYQIENLVPRTCPKGLCRRSEVGLRDAFGIGNVPLGWERQKKWTWHLFFENSNLLLKYEVVVHVASKCCESSHIPPIKMCRLWRSTIAMWGARVVTTHLLGDVGKGDELNKTTKGP